MGQSKTYSFIEVVGSNVLSYLIDVIFVMVAAPILGFDVHLTVISGAVALLYCIHILKSFVYRRFWNWLLIREHKRKGQEHE